MPQKPVIKGKKVEKKAAANKHGKGGITKKGKMHKPPTGGKALELYKESKELTKMINANNENNFASKAEGAGGKLRALKAGPPVFAPKSSKAAGKKAEQEADAQAGMDES